MIKSVKIHYMVFGTMAFLFALDCIKMPPVNHPSTTLSITNPEYRNFYGISWRGNSHENLIYARQMKYEYVFYQNDMEKDSLANGLFFYLETPEYFTYNVHLDVTKTYSVKEKAFFEKYCSLKNNTLPFPNNIAPGYFFNKTTFNPILDFQQQSVISYAIDSILSFIKKIESKNSKFHFGGLAWDVPNLPGDFWDTVPPCRKQVTLKNWTGGDFGIAYPSVKHDYPTYSEGHAQFYKQIYSKIRQQYPNARFIMEPYHIFEDWIDQIKKRPDARQLMPDLVCQECDGTEFVNDRRIYSDSLITADRVASTTPNIFGEENNRTVAALAALNGAWFTWYGRFGGTGNTPDYQSISDVPARLKLIRLLPNYENLNQTPLNERTWDGTTYKSRNAFADQQAIGVLQPGTSKYYFVLMTPDAQIPTPDNKTIVSISRTNNLFLESGDGSTDLIIQNGFIKLKNSAGMNNCYILNLKNRH